MMQHPGLIELGGALVNQFPAMRQEQHPAALLHGLADDLTADNGVVRDREIAEQK
jgi:hypothetical protein